MKLKKLPAIGLLALFATVLGCNGTTDPGTENPGPGNEGTPTGATALQPADSCAAVREQIVDSTTEQVLKRRYRQARRAASPDDASDGSKGKESGGESPDDYTETNTQEAGVDEADIVKTDGDYIYTVDDRELVILDSWPAEETSIVGRYTIGTSEDDSTGRDVSARSLFLKGDRAAVFSNISEYDRRSSHKPRFHGTRITILDVSNRSDPELLQQLDIGGYMVSGRMIDGDVYLVSNSGLNTPVDTWELAQSDDSRLPETGYDLTEEERKERVQEARPVVRELVRERLADEDISELFPKRRLFDNSGELVWSQSMYDCKDLYLPQESAQLGVLNISHFDFDSPATVTTTGLLADGWTVYSSEKNLYVAMSSRFWGWGWGWRNRDSESHIHKFSLDGSNNRPRYTASGSVDGWILDQFSMDEHEGFLRVATTESGGRFGNQEESKNHLTVLEQKGHALKEAGSVRGLAEGERIYSVRLRGDKGYMVTFRTIDPLFTLDLSDPYNPKVEGELKITGFSSYIHPLGENHLMTIGQDADDEGRIQGVQLQIFDVRDMSNPTRIHQERISTDQWSSWSEAMWNHHAFTYHPEREVLAFPINIRDWDRIGGKDFSGLLVYEANAQDGFTSLGRVSHADLEGDHRWWTTVRRSIFIEDYVYSLSERGMKVNDLRNPESERAAVNF